MGTLTRWLRIAPGLAAVVASGVLGAPWPIVLAGVAALAAAAFLEGRAAVLLGILVVLLVAAATPAASLWRLKGAGAVTVGILLAAQVLLLIHLRLPLAGLVAVPVAATVPAVWLLTPWAPTLLSSDIATRLQVLLLAVGALLALAVSRSLSRGRAAGPGT